MRIEKLKETVAESKENMIQYKKKRHKNDLIVMILDVFSQYGLIILYLLGVDWNSISLATITEITATLVIVETALGYVSKIFFSIREYSELCNHMEKEEEDLKIILDVYYSEEAKTLDTKPIKNIKLAPFSIRYLEESENDKPFTLVSENPIEIREGEIAILYGPSGSGKSTFMNMITQRIRINKSAEIPSTSRFMLYDEKLKFGSFSIYEELFCCSENPDFPKMQGILERLHLWSEIRANCHDVWQWMKEKNFEQALSNGQKQRLILAKMLYWLDENIDVLVLDEATSGLDDACNEENVADAAKILKYIAEFANSDRKRTIIIATHQDISSFIKKMAQKEYHFRILQFTKKGDCNHVEQKQ